VFLPQFIEIADITLDAAALAAPDIKPPGPAPSPLPPDCERFQLPPLDAGGYDLDILGVFEDDDE
jgi:hypothetical protein